MKIIIKRYVVQQWCGGNCWPDSAEFLDRETALNWVGQALKHVPTAKFKILFRHRTHITKDRLVQTL